VTDGAPRLRRGGRSGRRASVALLVTLVVSVAGIATALLWPTAETATSGESLRVSRPTFVAEFGTDGDGRLLEPVGIESDGGSVYVADAVRKEIVTFTAGGAFEGVLGKGRLARPLYLARNPLDGRLYVTDRQLKAIVVIRMDGSTVETFVPDPADAAATAVVASWQPLGLCFGDDGGLYVSDVGSTQRIVRFSPMRRYLGETPAATPAGPLSFVNGIAVVDGRVVTADSNNARLVTFSETLGFVRTTPFAGLPRGMAVVAGSGGRAFAVVDTTGGGVRIVSDAGGVLATFGTAGSGSGQLLQPTAVASDGHGTLFVTDTGNARVSVWRVSAGSESAYFEEAVRDPRWWVAVGFALLGGCMATTIILSGRKRSRTI
jgi:tripartite motif-containing protein 71